MCGLGWLLVETLRLSCTTCDIILQTIHLADYEYLSLVDWPREKENDSLLSGMN